MSGKIGPNPCERCGGTYGDHDPDCNLNGQQVTPKRAVVIATKTGDGGVTGLFSGERVEKDHVLIEAVGTLDELSAFLGLVKAEAAKPGHATRYNLAHDLMDAVQRDLIAVMGEVADMRVLKEPLLGEESIIRVDEWVTELQGLPQLAQTDWVLYGKTEIGARFDVASKVCRRAERRVISARRAFGTSRIRGEVVAYLNRLSDLLYLLARRAET